ncbi:MAG: metallophosphoesterase family protein [Candidatus Undinarchaeales archaeon]|nr:metallophosphoesterase family protein [Candidatus Undinarchaeales archaeon]MDP7492566.1 metallophosphoesterase family protein [Candidatus Undinarchaeales archaeon]
MRLLAIADLHGYMLGLRNILEAVSLDKIDLVLFAGDITNFGPVSELEEAMAALGDKQVLAVPGNCDLGDVIRALDGSAWGINGRSVAVKGITFAGTGGGHPDLGTILQAASDRDGPLVLVTHAPPSGTGAALLPNGQDIGSDEVHRAISQLSPTLVVCGHVHESPGRFQLGDTVVVNPGPAQDGRYALIKLGRKGMVSSVSLGRTGGW